MKFNLFILLFLISTSGCAKTVGQHKIYSTSSADRGDGWISDAVERSAVYLDRSVVIDGISKFPIPIMVRGNDPEGVSWQPSSIKSAAKEAREMLASEFHHEWLKEDARKICSSMLSYDIDSYMALCRTALCAALPRQVRDAECTFFDSFSSWMELNWIGVNCYASNEVPPTMISRQLGALGVSHCSDIYTAIMAGFLLELSGAAWTESDVVRAIIDRQKRN